MRVGQRHWHTQALMAVAEARGYSRICGGRPRTARYEELRLLRRIAATARSFSGLA